jgi:hypothetical protein
MNKHMELMKKLEAVRNDRIEFATTRPPGSQFATLDRRVVITAPPELVELSVAGELQVLDQLVALLKDPERAWAAVVLLAAMTRREEKIADNYSAIPDQWWEAFGKTAYERWSKWLDENRGKLVWNSEKQAFVERVD